MKKKFDYRLLIACGVFIVALVTIWITGDNRINNLINKKKEQIVPVSNTETNFNLKVIKTVNSTSKDENYLISPYSMEVALRMLKEGANGNTKDEVEKLVGSRVIKDITSEKVKVANAMFVKDEYKSIIEEDFYNKLKKDFNSEIIYDEFVKPNVINDWVNKNTDGMIKRILDSMSPDFVLGLANAIAIDVEWQNPFECNNTSSKEFINGDKKTNVEMMYKNYESNIKYLKNDKEESVVIPYREYDGKQLEVQIVMPSSNLSKYIDELTEEKLKSLGSELKELKSKQELNLELPRFSYSYSLDNFMQVLVAMGMKDAFDPEKADFTRIITKENIDKNNLVNIYVSEAIHKTYIDLNEKGTRAAAVTYFGFNKATYMPIEKEIINITFNKPFLYMIRDTKTKELLFFGTVYEPNKWQGSTCDKEK